MSLSLLDFELRTGQRVPRGADVEEKLSFHTHMLLFPVPQPEADPAGEAGLCSVLWSLPPCCPEAPRLPLPHRRAHLAEGAWSCLGGEQEANFRPGDSLPTAVAAWQWGWAARREPWARPSRSALGNTFLPLSQLQDGLGGQGFLCTGGGTLNLGGTCFLQVFLFPSCMKIAQSSFSFEVALYPGNY